ncbi:MAG: undecaprenyldiphospho-muramoylpentapeptide beta-N-acetylglucosaminyltransferase [Methylococcales bacterium]|nr:undecaprenyldiphospho-muramoylpentapeptide beta-N-acetylglucosaminyltransferase [Methylococcales bacterium]
MAKTIVIMAGGTGGHVFPALAVAEYLRARGWTVTWLGTRQGLESRVIPEKGFAIDWLPVSGFRGKGVIGKITAGVRLLSALWQAFLHLRRRRPDVVLGMGGFAAGPGGLVASLLGIPLVIHEQNRIPGTTNRILAKRARFVLQAFPESFKANIEAITTGNPLRAGFTAAIPEAYQSGQVLKILVVGGSQGARRLNEVVPAGLALLSGIEIWHQTGQHDLDTVMSRYQNLALTAKVMAFIDDMTAAYRWADVVVCRAGAMTVSEVAALGVPALFIPLPNAIDDHQRANAVFLSEQNAARLLAQQDLTAESLAETLNDMRDQLPDYARAALSLARPDATEQVAAYCEQAAL